MSGIAVESAWDGWEVDGSLLLLLLLLGLRGFFGFCSPTCFGGSPTTACSSLFVTTTLFQVYIFKRHIVVVVVVVVVKLGGGSGTGTASGIDAFSVFESIVGCWTISSLTKKPFCAITFVRMLLVVAFWLINAWLGADADACWITGGGGACGSTLLVEAVSASFVFLMLGFRGFRGLASFLGRFSIFLLKTNR